MVLMVLGMFVMQSLPALGTVYMVAEHASLVVLALWSCTANIVVAAAWHGRLSIVVTAAH